MAMKKLIQSVTSLSLTSSPTLLQTNSIYLSSQRLISSSGCLCRKLDSHAHPPYMFPSSKHGRWVPRVPFRDRYEYTIKPLPHPKTGGRGPNGRIWNHRRAGGKKWDYFMIDWQRGSFANRDGTAERVEKIMDDPNRSAKIALVASGEKKRYLIATQNMKAGDVIKTSLEVTRSPVRPIEGDSHPLGSLPLGTLVNCVERYAGAGGLVARSAGVSAILLRKQDNMCVLRMPSKREIVIAPNCLATVGRVSNIDHNKRVIGKAGRNRWLGFKPRSGRWHRKTGFAGRKINPIKPASVYIAPPKPKQLEGRFTLPNAPGIFESWRY